MEQKLKVIFIVLLVLLIGVSGVKIFCSVYFQPKASVERELESLAKDYYENYYYDSLENPAEVLAEFRETGLPTAYLRKLLAFDNGRHAASAEVFDSAKYKCDTNTTGVKIFPEEPYGKTDYRVEYKYACEEL